MAAFSSSRMSMGGAATGRPGLNVTPRASPLLKTPTTKSPSKNSRDEQDLALRRVIGTTTSSNNAFACLESPRCFAFTAGGAAVVATIDDAFHITQQVFRAKPMLNSSNASTYDSPTPAGSSQGVRARTAASLREAGLGILSFASSSHDSSDSPGSRKAAAGERTKAATCVSLSPDGRLVAIGETGYRPRVLVFSTARDASSDTPLTTLSEHTFGVRCVAFSPDSQYLASLGDANDGFLYIWSVNPRNGAVSLHANNKCTSNVRQMIWLGSSLITIGTRHVKIWRVDDAGKVSPPKRFSEVAFSFSSPSKALSGRNCLLGPLLDKVFIAACPIAADKAVVCTDQGDVCVLDDNDSLPQLTKFAETGFATCSVAVHRRKYIIVAGTEGQCMVYSISQALECTASKSTPDMLEGTLFQSHPTSHMTVALASIGNNMIVVDSQRNIEVLALSSSKDDHTFSAVRKTSLPAHGGAVLGVQSLAAPNPLDASFLTWSAEGSIMAWGFDGIIRTSCKVEIEQPDQGEDDLVNELRVARAFQASTLVVTGDKLGVLRVMPLSEKGKVLYETRAHQGEITNIAVHEKDDQILIATSGRDRMVQLFRWLPKNTGELLQTLDEHAGAVTCVIFAADGKQLLSCSSDRTVVVRDVISGQLGGKAATTAYVVIRTITLKSSPLSLEAITNQEGGLLVSTIDRQVLKYDFRTGNLLSSFKATDADGGDSVIMGPVIHVPLSAQSMLMAGVSSTDKSIRVYNETGRLIGRDYGHTEGMSGIALVQDGENSAKKALVTGATDGTIFVWALPSDSEELHDMFDVATMTISPINTKPPSSFSTRPPLRKVLSTSDLMRLQEQQEDSDDISPGSSFTTGHKSPRRRASKMSLLQSNTPKLEPSPLPNNRRRAKSPVPNESGPKAGTRRSSTLSRPSSPPSPKRYSQTLRASSSRPSTLAAPAAPVRRKSMGTTSSSNSRSEFNALAASTEQICKSLHAFRKKLATSSDVLPLENVRDLERELSSTARSLSEKASRNETVMVKLLDQYSERLVGMLEERIESSVARRVKQHAAGSSDDDDTDDATGTTNTTTPANGVKV